MALIIFLLKKKINLNLLNFYDVEKWFSKNKPDVVILAAARVGVFMLINQDQQIFLWKI